MRGGTILREPLAIARDGSRADQRRRIADILREVGLPASAVDRDPQLSSPVAAAAARTGPGR